MHTEIKPIPEGYHSLTPYIIVANAAEAIEFYKRAFGAVEKFRMPSSTGKVVHCELQIGDSVIMMADEYCGFSNENAAAPTGKARAFSLLLYVDDVDAIFKRAIEAGAQVIRPLKNEFFGDRMGTLADPFGHHWTLATQVEIVSPEELKKRTEKMFQSMQ